MSFTATCYPPHSPYTPTQTFRWAKLERDLILRWIPGEPLPKGAFANFRRKLRKHLSEQLDLTDYVGYHYVMHLAEPPKQLDQRGIWEQAIKLTIRGPKSLFLLKSCLDGSNQVFLDKAYVALENALEIALKARVKKRPPRAPKKPKTYWEHLLTGRDL